MLHWLPYFRLFFSFSYFYQKVVKTRLTPLLLLVGHDPPSPHTPSYIIRLVWSYLLQWQWRIWGQFTASKNGKWKKKIFFEVCRLLFDLFLLLLWSFSLLVPLSLAVNRPFGGTSDPASVPKMSRTQWCSSEILIKLSIGTPHFPHPWGNLNPPPYQKVCTRHRLWVGSPLASPGSTA